MGVFYLEGKIQKKTLRRVQSIKRNIDADLRTEEAKNALAKLTRDFIFILLLLCFFGRGKSGFDEPLPNIIIYMLLAVFF